MPFSYTSALFMTACLFSAVALESPEVSCGMTASPDCLNDMGSCGNACCAAEFPSSLVSASLFNKIAVYLKSGGADGLFNYSGGTGGLSIATPDGSWSSIFQGTHTTFKKRYIDTINFAIRKLPGSGSTVRIFSISSIAGALGDMGQNRRTVSFLGSELGLGPMAVLFGCGGTPSLPAVSETGDMWNQQAASKQRPVGLMSPSPQASFNIVLLMFIACGVFFAGMVVGSKITFSYPKTEPLLVA